MSDLQKKKRVRSKKLRESAKDAPRCFGCGLQNPNRDLLCLAHSNLQADGRGIGLKSDDDKGAIMCHPCHFYVDYGKDSREARLAYHRNAAEKTTDWWIKEGYVQPRSNSVNNRRR